MKTKMIKSENHDGYIVPNELDMNSITFHIDLPKCATVDHIRIKGKFKVNKVDSCENVLLEDIPVAVSVTYHKEMEIKVHNPERMQRVAGTVHFKREIPQDLLEKLQFGEICDFEVYYHEEYVAEVE